MKLGIVGSRRRHSIIDWQIIEHRILKLKPTMLISGGCPLGADRFAEDFARKLGIPITIFYPKLSQGGGREKVREAMYARNDRIADESDHLIALVASDRKGGTENTIKYFKERKSLFWKDKLEIL
jgi:hypothetical protein